MTGSNERGAYGGKEHHRPEAQLPPRPQGEKTADRHRRTPPRRSSSASKGRRSPHRGILRASSRHGEAGRADGRASPPTTSRTRRRAETPPRRWRETGSPSRARSHSREPPWREQSGGRARTPVRGPLTALARHRSHNINEERASLRASQCSRSPLRSDQLQWRDQEWRDSGRQPRDGPAGYRGPTREADPVPLILPSFVRRGRDSPLRERGDTSRVPHRHPPGDPPDRVGDGGRNQSASIGRVHVIGLPDLHGKLTARGTRSPEGARSHYSSSARRDRIPFKQHSEGAADEGSRPKGQAAEYSECERRARSRSRENRPQLGDLHRSGSTGRRERGVLKPLTDGDLRGTGAEDQPHEVGQPAHMSDPALDFFSPQFDAEKALHTPGVVPPVPDAPVLDNIYRCRRILPPEDPQSLSALLALKQKSINPSKAMESAAIREKVRHRTAAGAERRVREACRGQSTLHKIAEKVGAQGPLSLLARCLFTGTRVRVVTRHAVGIRGVATGLLQGFDRHMNLVLTDVKEHYKVRLKVQRTKFVTVEPVTGSETDASGAKQVEKTRSGFKQEDRVRHLAAVFLKGNNIVLISPVTPLPVPAPPD
eukprot:jgi/Botrbrau1/1216/Bobra.0163s0024.1